VFNNQNAVFFCQSAKLKKTFCLSKMVMLKLKWNKLTFENVDFNVADGVPALKKKVCDLTGVPESRQKLMSKSWTGILKDDAVLADLSFANNQQILLMGTADVNLGILAKPVTFLEDMTAAQKATQG
jgi:ubiquitin carboxyl-terminal hydrolase 14